MTALFFGQGTRFERTSFEEGIFKGKGARLYGEFRLSGPILGGRAAVFHSVLRYQKCLESYIGRATTPSAVELGQSR